MKIDLHELMKKDCSCAASENKILLEAITVCPGCLTLRSTVAYEIPPGQVDKVLNRVFEVMEEMGMKRKGAVLEQKLPGPAELAQEGP